MRVVALPGSRTPAHLLSRGSSHECTPNGRPNSAFEALFSKSKENAPEYPSRFAPPSPIGDNGSDPSATPLANGANGADPLAPPLANGANGPAAILPPARKSPGGRDKNGRFTGGNIGGPGNPFDRRCAQMRRAVCEAVSEEEIKALIRVLFDQAKGGDLAAAKLLLAYVVGRPAEMVDPNSLDFHEWQHFQ